MSFTVDDIFTSEKKHCLLKLVIPKASEAVCARLTKVCDIEIDYLDVVSKDRVEIKSKADIQYVKPSKIQKKADEVVKRQLFLLEAARIQKEAKEKADKGLYMEAKQILNNGLTWVTTVPFDTPSGTSAVESVQTMFTNMSSNCINYDTYNTKGRTMASAYSTTLTSARCASVSSMDAGLTYCNASIDNLVGSFSAGTSNPIVDGISGTGTTIKDIKNKKISKKSI
jgi:hypothetical protein